MSDTIMTESIMAEEAKTGRKVGGEPFFYYFALTLFIVVFAGFTLNTIVNFAEFDRFTVWIALHALFNGGWYIMLATQARLIRKRNRAFHMKMGKLSVLLAVGTVISGAVMTIDLYHDGWLNPERDPGNFEDHQGAAALVYGTFMQWVVFLGLYIGAIAKRYKPATHKRLMMGTGIVMSFAGTTRLLGLVGLSGFAALPTVILMFIAMFIYDWRKDRKIHAGTIVTTVSILGMIASFFVIGQSDWFVNFIKDTMGPA